MNRNCFTCFLILIAISASNLVAQIHWTVATNKPVLELGEQGTWDGAVVTAPMIILDGDTLRMWYTGCGAISPKDSLYMPAIGYAWSVDGTNWTKHPNNPVIKPALPWEKGNVSYAKLLKDGDIWRMWYQTGDYAVCYATSKDGISWDKYPDLRLKPGPKGSWDAKIVQPCTVLKEDGRYMMWYQGSQSWPDEGRHFIGLAVSEDGIHWVKYDNPLTTHPPYAASDPVMMASAPPAWDDMRTARPCVFRSEAGFEMFYTGRGGRTQTDEFIGYATSPDGVSWTKYRKNPVISKYPDWANGITWPMVLRIDEQYHMWLAGYNNFGYSTGIGYRLSPPWWHTGWAYVLFAVLGCTVLSGVVYGTWRTFSNRARLRNELRMKRFETEKLQELDQLKSRFFANISHEFRTPLTLILGPIDKMLTELKESQWGADLSLMKKHTRRVLDLVAQLLDLSRLEADRMKLQASLLDVVLILKGLVQSFASMADRQKITLSFNTEMEEVQAYVDKDAIVKIMNNLLSNAFKFTKAGGRIQINVTSNRDSDLSTEGELIIAISDTGIGIPVNRIDKIFNRFYQVDSSKTREGEGTGIGLALTRELVELHQGHIEVESKRSVGTTFTVRLPLGNTHLSADEIVEEPEAQEEVVPVDVRIQDEEEKRKSLTTRKSLPLLLIVEDNADVRSYVRSYLDEDYRCLEAVDGEDGLDQATKRIPDLILSDIMMPKMDGVEFCRRIKTDERTSHIPVILLTAKADMDSRLEGLDTGADDYLVKPFEAVELQVRIRNLIEQRRLLREKFGQKAILHPKDITVTSVDERFLQRALDVVEMHMSDEGFNVEEFSKAVSMSRANLHRKLRALTNHSSSEFIRTLRLNHAEQLLKQNFGSVSEVAFEVGFSNPTYFSKCFKKQFGLPPSQYT